MKIWKGFWEEPRSKKSKTMVKVLLHLVLYAQNEASSSTGRLGRGVCQLLQSRPIERERNDINEDSSSLGRLDTVCSGRDVEYDFGCGEGERSSEAHRVIGAVAKITSAEL